MRVRDRIVISIQSTAGLKIARTLTRKTGGNGWGKRDLGLVFIARLFSKEGENAGKKRDQKPRPKKIE